MAFTGNAAVVSSYPALRLLSSSANQTAFVAAAQTAPDGGGGTYAYIPTDTSSGCLFTASVSGTTLTVSSVSNGTLAPGLSVNRGDTGASIGTTLKFGTGGTTGTGGTGTYALSASASIAGPLSFTADNNSSFIVAVDGGRWFNVGYYQQTAAEIAAGVTPVNYTYAPGHVYRYGSNTTPGTTDMTSAINAAANVCRQGNYTLLLPSDTCLVSNSLNFSGIRVVGPVSYPLIAIKAITGVTGQLATQFNVITSTGNSVFENFGVDGGWDSVTTGLTGDTFSLVGSPTCYGITFKNVRAWYNKARGVHWQTAGYSMVEALDVFNSCLDGIAIFAPNLANISTTVHIFGNSRSSGSLQGGGLRITEANSIYCDGMIMENNAHGIQLAGNDNRNLVFRNIYQEVIADTVFLDGTTSAGVGLTIANCYDPAATVANLTGWTNVYLPNNVFLQRPLLPMPDRIVQNDGGNATTSTINGVSVTAAQITLNPGTWLIFGTVQTLQSSASGLVQSACQITSSSSASGLNNSPNDGVFGVGATQQNFTPNGGSMDHRLNCFTLLQVATQTTYYLRAFFNFSGAGALAYHGYLNALLFE